MHHSYTIPVLKGLNAANGTSNDLKEALEVISQIMGTDLSPKTTPAENSDATVEAEIKIEQDDYDNKPSPGPTDVDNSISPKEQTDVDESMSPFEENDTDESDAVSGSKRKPNTVQSNRVSKKRPKGNFVKWFTFEHNGIYFPPEYAPHGVKMKYDGVPITLSPAAEEAATFYAARLDTRHVKSRTFQKNFFKDWKKVLKQDPQNPKITDFSKCDFTPIWKKLKEDKEKKHDPVMIEIKKAQKKSREFYSYAIVDGRKEPLSHHKVPPPGIYLTKSDHSKNGRLRRRVMPEEITLNIGKDATVPQPPEGHVWGKIIHNQDACWLARWTDPVSKEYKYIVLANPPGWKSADDYEQV